MAKKGGLLPAFLLCGGQSPPGFPAPGISRRKYNAEQGL